MSHDIVVVVGDPCPVRSGQEKESLPEMPEPEAALRRRRAGLWELHARRYCLPVPQEVHEQYPVRYVQSLELHAADLERKLNERLPGSAADHLPFMISPQREPPRRSVERGSHVLFQEPTVLRNPRSPYYVGTLRDEWHPPELVPDAAARIRSSPQDLSTFADYYRAGTSSMSPPQDYHVPAATEDITISTAASFFRTYFAYIHPQYPFLSIEDCNEWYLQWKTAPKHLPIRGWPAFFVKMIFAIGSLIQSRDSSSQDQHQTLKAQAQAEQGIVADSKSTILVRMQAMLLSAMLALHGESTSRIIHVIGAIMRFAAAHDFHRLVDDGSEEANLRIKVWSCAYSIDRATSHCFDVPVSLPDMYISSPLYEERLEAHHNMVWLLDCPPSPTPNINPSLSTFAHVCKIRLIQSYIMHTIHSIPFGSSATPEWEESMRVEIDKWAHTDEIAAHRYGQDSPDRTHR
ncbi:hypothetical protein BP6252_08261 [Coleophoma cylindrospora]|uniref:Xylanolytic transcriptional activator regulatory domain-containing protein n=1 Tax=Coleophoma cylindrospora TaxID=1849047 RepID=A0A3D8R5N1_9HELO|nr:hypothetical protein BP6252_08261 [Coleophoma cylindrospora]